MELCCTDHGIKDTSKHDIKIKIAVGNTGLRTINSSGLTTEHQNDSDKLWNHFQSQQRIKFNFRIHISDELSTKTKQNLRRVCQSLSTQSSVREDNK